MAYQAFSEGVGGLTIGQPLARAAFSSLEWSVVALAERDRPSSLRTPGRLGRAMRVLFGLKGSSQLADPQLEALRRMAVLSWRRGYSVESHEVRAFLAAGFTAPQYELLVDRIARTRAARRVRQA